MFCINNKKNKSAVILNPERSEWVSRSHVTSVDSVVNDGAKTKRYSAKRDLYARSPKGSRLKMTEKTLSLSGASSEPIISAESKKNKPRYSVNCCAISEYDLLLASPKGSLHRHPERSEGSIKNNIKDWILRFAKVPLRMTISTLFLILILSFTAISESQAGCEGCEGECNYLGCGYSCTACKDGYELYDNCWFKSCRKKCAANETRNIRGACVKTTGDPGDVAVTGGWITPSACSNGGGYKCISDNGFIAANCCYKTEGDTTTVYPEDPKQNYVPYFPGPYIHNAQNLVISEGFNYVESATFTGNYNSIKLPEGIRLMTDWCAGMNTDLNELIMPDNIIHTDTNFGCESHIQKITCIGDVEICKNKVPLSLQNKIFSANESQCNGSGSYYFTGSSCEHRPTDGTDITCEHEISGYVKVGNYCVSPENSYAKKHYTPAEAAQWLHDGNDNFVVITFKK